MSDRALDRGLASLRDAPWLTPERARGYALVFLALFALAALGWVAASRGGLDPLGKPLGTDFQSFWTASQLALSGRPADAYDPAVHAAAQRAAFAGRDVGYAAFFYPPVYLLICLPLALLPYLPALAAWLAATGYAYWRMARALLGAGRTLALPALALPAAFLNAGHGQNGFLTAALFGAGALALKRRPLLAGACFGALVFKPHLGLLIPLALALSGRWRAIAAATAVALALGLASLAVFGPETWGAFLAISPLARASLEQDLVGAEKMQSAFAAVRLLHGPVTAAYLAQGVFALFAAATVAVVARRTRDLDALGPVMAAAAVLATPFLLDYDLILLAVPLAWGLREGARTGFLPWEKTVLAAGFVLPLVSRLAAGAAGLPLAPAILTAVLLVTARRALATGGPR
jgi:hypothetical protein